VKESGKKLGRMGRKDVGRERSREIGRKAE
jgi:hypothetical protein